MERSEIHEGLIDQIYEAAVYPEKWGPALHNLAGISRSAGGVILLRRSDNWIGWRYSQGLRGAKAYLKSDAPARSTTTARLLAKGRAGFVCGSEVFSDQEFRADAMYTAWAGPNGLHHGAATAIHTPSADLVVVHMQRDAGVPHFDEDDRALLDTFRPHLARAGLLAARLQFERFHAIARGLELVGLPAVLLDNRGRLICANRLAEEMEGHIGWGAGDRIYLRDARADVRLQEALSTAPHAGAVASCSIPSRSREAGAAIVHLIPVAGTARDLFEGGCTILLMTPIGARPIQDAALLQGLFDLTAAEADICRHLAHGDDLELISQQRGSSIDTVRAQLKSVFAKTGQSRQADLVRMLASFIAPPSS